MKVLAIVGEFKEKILKKEKTITIRLPGRKKYRKGETVRIDCGDKILGKAVIKNVYRKKIKELTEEEVKKDGFESISELIKTLRKLYNRKITPDTEVEIIEFELKEIIEKDFYEFYYGNYDIIEIAKKGLEMDLSEKEKEILRVLIKTKSIRKTAEILFGSIGKRYLVRKVLRKVLKKVRKSDNNI